MKMRRRWLFILLLLLVPLVVYGFIQWREAGRQGGQRYAEPFRVAGNLYYVGANDVASFLITGPNGHVLIDGGYPRTPKLIMASIDSLGFDIKDVKIILNTEPHYDHAGGIAELKDSSGAQLWTSEPTKEVIESGGADPAMILPIRMLRWTGLTRYSSASVDHLIKDGDTVSVGPVKLVAHITPGHTRGCTSWEIPVVDGDRQLRAVVVCSLNWMAGMDYPGQKADFERSFRVLRDLRADIWTTIHARDFGRYRKFLEIGKGANPFIDPDGYRAYIDTAQARFRRGQKN
jgi:metallo-beta-lactamase class B